MTRTRLAFVFGSSFCLASLPSLMFAGAHQSSVRKPQEEGSIRADRWLLYPPRQEMTLRPLQQAANPVASAAEMPLYLSARRRSRVRRPAPPLVRLRYTTVQVGDTLWGISRRYKVPLQALEQWNHLSVESVLQVGQRIEYSQTETLSKTYTHAAVAERSVVLEPHPQKTSTSLSSRSEIAIANLSSGLLGAQISKYAELYLGVPYRWAGESPISGFDCSGLVQFVLAHFGIQVGRSSYEQFAQGTPVYRYDLLPGDLVFFDTGGQGPSHVGIFLGGDRFISASGTTVRVTSLAQSYWARHYIGARRIRSPYAA